MAAILSLESINDHHNAVKELVELFMLSELQCILDQSLKMIFNVILLAPNTVHTSRCP